MKYWTQSFIKKCMMVWNGFDNTTLAVKVMNTAVGDLGLSISMIHTQDKGSEKPWFGAW